MRATFAWVALAACGNSHPDPGPVDAAPVQAFTLTEVGRIPNVDVFDLEVVDGVLYALQQGPDEMATYSLADPTAPARLGGLPTAGGGGNTRCSIVGDRAYLAYENDGVLIADVSNPATPTLLGTYIDNTYAKDVAIAGTLAFVADQDSGLVIAEVGNPSAATRVGAFPSAGPFGIAVAGDRAFLADNTGGLVIVDVSTPASPQLLGSDAALEELRAIAVRDSIVYTAQSSSVSNGLRIVDVANPAAPAVIASMPLGELDDLILDGNVLFTIASTLEAIDVSSPSSPVSITTGPSGNLNAIAVFDRYVYIGDGQATALVVLERVFQ